MSQEAIQEGFDVFLHDGAKSVAAVRQVRKHEIVIYVENAGDFVVPLSAVKDVQSEKVTLDPAKLSAELKTAIAREHVAEDPRLG